MDDKNISNQEKKAPLGVKIIAVLSILLSLYPIIFTTIGILSDSKNYSNQREYWGWIFFIYAPILFLLIIIAVCISLTAAMFWKGKNWARIILLIFSIIGLSFYLWLGIGAFYSDYSSSFSLLKTHILAYTTFVVGIVLSSSAIFYLIFNKKVKEFFKKQTV